MADIGKVVMTAVTGMFWMQYIHVPDAKSMA
jgi:hypothetical protein